MRFVLCSFFLLTTFLFNAQSLNYKEYSPHSVNGDTFEKMFTIGKDGQGTIYVAGKNSKIYQFKDDEWSSFNIPNSNDEVEEIVGDSSGNLFVAIKNEGLWVRMDGIWKIFDSNNSKYPEKPIHGGIIWDKNDKKLLVGTNNGLVKYQNDSISIFDFNTVGVELVDDEIFDIVMDNDGSIWLISNLSTLIHYSKGKFTSMSVGFDLKIFDMVFTGIKIKSNDDIVISTSNHGLLSFNRTEFEFDTSFNDNFLLIDVDEMDNIWGSDKRTLWKSSGESIKTYKGAIIPDFLYDIFVSSDNHVWLVGDNGPIIEIIQELPNNVISGFDIKSDINIFPNPINKGDFIHFGINGEKLKGNISFYNIFNQKVFVSPLTKSLKINLDKGFYLVRFEKEEHSIVRRLIVN